MANLHETTKAVVVNHIAIFCFLGRKLVGSVRRRGPWVSSRSKISDEVLAAVSP
jgi:hypothetical protein